MNTTRTKQQTQATKEQSLFRPLDFFMLRSPVLSLELYQKLFPLQDTSAVDLRADGIAKLAELASQSLIREAIAVASPSLLHSLSNLTSSDPRKQDQAVKGFLRYLLRMMSRPTPFGLFSGVATGTFAEQAQLSVHGALRHQKRARPDMEWLLKVIERIEADNRVVLQLNVRANSMISRDGSRAKLPYVTRYGQRDEQGRISMDTVSVRATPVLDRVLEETAEPVVLAELLAKIAAEFQAPEETVQQYLLTLFRQEYLISELRPPTTITSPLDYVLARIDRLQGVEEIRAKLLAIADKLAVYDELPIGEGDTLFLELVEEMKELGDVKSPLQVDLALAADPLALPASAAEEAATAASVLFKLTSPRIGYPNWESYRHEFMEKYGPYREIPLLELLDEDRGLGAPAGYENPPSRRRAEAQKRSDETKKRHALQTNWLAQALAQGAMEVELTDEMIAELAGDVQTNTLPPSMEMYFTVAAKSQAALDAGDFRLHVGPMPGSDGAGRTFGRFVDLLPAEFRSQLATVQEAEQRLEPDALLVEVAFLPSAGRATNVVLTDHCRPYEMAMGTNSSKDAAHTLPLSDLLVGCNDDGLYLKSRSLCKQVIPKVGHMLNPRATPNLYRFLRELGSERQSIWLPFRWEVMEQAPFLPRVRYGRTVLLPAAWQLNENTSELRAAMNDDAWQAGFQVWRKTWKVPRYVYLLEADNRILLDLDHPLHLEIVQKESSKGEVKLIEMGAAFDDLCIASPDGLLLNEVVIPLVKRDESPGKRLKLQNLQVIPARERLSLPGSEWLFVKLYGVSSRQEELIGGQLREFCRDVQAQGLAQKSYFMRYVDDGPHIRLRFHGAPETISAGLLPRLHHWGLDLQKEGLISHYTLDAYDPEIERYGGPQLMKTVEELFAKDSIAVAQWLFGKRFQKMSLTLDQIGAVSVIDYLEQFGLSFAEAFRWLDLRVSHKEQQDAFRQDRKLFLRIANSADDWAGLRAHPEGEAVYAGLKLRRDEVRRYAEDVRATGERGELFNDRHNIIGSVIHLHLNRLLGTDRVREKAVMTLARHALNALRHFREDTR
ncbi:thiopeptide-type bacteriocin biosynthesis protein [Tumebacillus sp. BK434]|uniref:lantibiotic dehydratase n=1 Tax=Tumebacillus sp. BK434 TaxID=2512169 RepID=UPI0010455F87|nr:lantibiotic dehydratase [Tumebacillus sp. BK434]TCP54492.1 thiopeptide-type bacteriocin biosynthesis protein [Tumebacillus sp. BK434]